MLTLRKPLKSLQADWNIFRTTDTPNARDYLRQSCWLFLERCFSPLFFHSTWYPHVCLKLYLFVTDLQNHWYNFLTLLQEFWLTDLMLNFFFAYAHFVKHKRFHLYFENWGFLWGALFGYVLRKGKARKAVIHQLVLSLTLKVWYKLDLTVSTDMIQISCDFMIPAVSLSG